MRKTVVLVVCGVTLAVFSAGCKKNRPPTAPQVSGPTLGKPGATLTYVFSSTDAENQEIAYTVAWGDTSTVAWSSSYASAQQVTQTHSYADSGVYRVKVKARDTQLAESEWSDSILVSIGFRPPNQPGKPSGPASCSTDIAYTFTAKTTHPQGDSVWFQFDWGGVVGNWGGPVASDSQFQEQHVFDSAGTFSIMVRAKDARGGTSTWSEPMDVSVTWGETLALTKPVVTHEAISTGAALRLSWFAVTNAKSYEVKTDDSIYTTTSTSFDVTYPTGTVEVRAVNGNRKSDPATIDCRTVETSSLVLYGISDVSPGDPSGLAFTASGSASALSLDDANKASIDFVCDDQQARVLPVGFINAGDYCWPQNSKINALVDAGTTDYDAFDFAPSNGYTTQLRTQANGVYALWLSSSGTWTTNDHFCKAKIISVEQPSGTYYKVTLRTGYQLIGGLRWVKSD